MIATKESAGSDSQIQRSITGLYKQFLFGLELLLEKTSSSDIIALASGLLPEYPEYSYSGGLLRLDNSLLLVQERGSGKWGEIWVSHLPPHRRILNFSERFLKKERKCIKDSQPDGDLTAIGSRLWSADGCFHLPLPGMIFIAEHSFKSSSDTETKEPRVHAGLHMAFSTENDLSSVLFTNLYFPHLPNTVGDIGVCLGKNDLTKKVADGTLANTKHLLRLYFQSKFTRLSIEEKYRPGMEQLGLSGVLEWQLQSEFPMSRMAVRFSSRKLLTEVEKMLSQNGEPSTDRLLTAIIRGLQHKPQQLITYLEPSERSAQQLSDFGQSCAEHLAALRKIIGAGGLNYQKGSTARWIMKNRLESELSSFSQTVEGVI